VGLTNRSRLKPTTSSHMRLLTAGCMRRRSCKAAARW
jgi:hypothetical protein